MNYRPFKISPDIVVDEDDPPHIVYWDNVNDDVIYKWWGGEGWETEKVEDTDIGFSWTYTYIEIDGEGKPHILYSFQNRNTHESDLKYGVKEGDSWHVDNIYTSSNAEYFCALEVTDGGTPHVPYYHESKEILVYAVKEDGVWTREELYIEGGSHSFALDEEGDPHILCSGDPLRYITKSEGGWTSEEVFYGFEAYHNSITIGPEGRPHICFEIDDLYYGVREEDDWKIETVESSTEETGDIYFFSDDLDVDEEGTVRVSYLKNYTNKLAVKDQEGWTTESAVENGTIH